MFQIIRNIFGCIRYARLLNKSLFTDDPITISELILWINSYGSAQVLKDLKKHWDHHNDYDVETF